ncbi:hypothetical protein N802_10130 [Knoellia sinensis KCTC 19936]|uniref:Uncharacterized protein n=1 Tax=Knoellia sinensis KCTC 19936 TaxID=1385520 RepID=A0A0A0IZV1_9MICO|nr:hypothetical protein [Knoellia sinensis]KGN29984.1 hypothetical protein N802_10130 [Knoellia sinensis KCTC 19936]
MTWIAVLTLVWLVMAALGLQARQRGSARSARRWTTRLYAVTLVPVTALAVGAALVAVQLPGIDPGNGPAIGQAIAAATPYAQWLALAINLVLVDVVLRRAEGHEHARRQTASRPWTVSTHRPVAASGAAALPLPCPGAEARPRRQGERTAYRFTRHSPPKPPRRLARG